MFGYWKMKSRQAYPLKAVGLFLKFPFSMSGRNGLHAASVQDISKNIVGKHYSGWF